MTARFETIEAVPAVIMPEIGQRARGAARVLATTPAEQKDAALSAMERALREGKSAILAANALDLAEAKARGATPAVLDRLALDERRVLAMAEAFAVVRALPDPVGKVTERWTRPNGMTI